MIPTRGKGYGAPPPDDVRIAVRAGKPPALAVRCPHCEAQPRAVCTTPSKRHRMLRPHPARVAAWVRSIAVCPTCQVEPGVECHTDGWPLANGAVHVARDEEAQVTA